jgi:hypothetical protein
MQDLLHTVKVTEHDQLSLGSIETHLLRQACIRIMQLDSSFTHKQFTCIAYVIPECSLGFPHRAHLVGHVPK